MLVRCGSDDCRPQGSILCPTLFFYFVNNMPEIIKNASSRFLLMTLSDIIIYIFYMHSDEYRGLLQNSIDQLVQCTKD